MLRAFQTLNGYALGLGDTLSARGIFDGVLGVLRQWYGLQNLQARYGSPLMVLNLLKTAEKQPRESLLGKEYELAIDQVNKKVKILRCFCHRPRSVHPLDPLDVLFCIPGELTYMPIHWASKSATTVT